MLKFSFLVRPWTMPFDNVTVIRSSFNAAFRFSWSFSWLTRTHEEKRWNASKAVSCVWVTRRIGNDDWPTSTFIHCVSVWSQLSDSSTNSVWLLSHRFYFRDTSCFQKHMNTVRPTQTNMPMTSSWVHCIALRFTAQATFSVQQTPLHEKWDFRLRKRT